MIGVDGDELHDPWGLAGLLQSLLQGAYEDVFRSRAHVLNCDELDRSARTASGWLAPPSRSVTKLFNFGAVESWTHSSDPLQGGDVVFSEGYYWESRRDLYATSSRDTDPLRCLHVCNLRRSTRESAHGRCQDG